MTALFSEFPQATHEDWVEAVRQSLRGKPLDSLVKHTYEGIAIHALASAADPEAVAHPHILPGQFPFLRGTSARARPWLIAQDIDIQEPRDFNRALQEALANGQTAITITKALSLKDEEDLRAAVADIDLTRYPLFMRDHERAADVYSLLCRIFSHAKLAQLRGCFGCDPLSDLASKGATPADAFEEMARHVAHVDEQSPQLGAIAVSTAVYHDAGANAVQELAIALATGTAYLRALCDRGCAADDVAGKMHFFLNIGENFFIEIAKFRAIKSLWAQVARAFGSGMDGQKIRLHARSGSRNKTRRDPHVNLLRLTTEALSAAFGGADSICLAPYDAALGTSDAFSRRLSRNLQLILQEELNLVNLIDPLGGAWHVEKLTDQLARAAWTRFQAIEAAGGMQACLEAGAIQAEVGTVAAQRRRDLDARDAILVGCNRYADPDETLPPLADQPQSAARELTLGERIEAVPLHPIRLSAPFEASRHQSGGGA